MQTTGNLGLKKPEGTDIVDIADLNGNMDILDNAVTSKVDKVTGKQLSTNDYTAAEKTKLAGIATGANNYTHPNHTGDVTSNGDGVTAITAGAIVDADVNTAAAIAWSKLNKAGASLADLPTRSAADLNSGTLPVARLPAATADVTSPAGSNTFTLSAGIQGQINSKAPLATTPQQTTADITYYVRTDGNDNNTGLVNMAGGAFKTWAKAISAIPPIVNHTVNINVANGTYAESVSLGGFSGSGIITINPSASAISDLCLINAITLYRCSIPVIVKGVRAVSTTENGFGAVSCIDAQFLYCKVISAASSAGGLVVNSSKAYAYGCIFSNRNIGLNAGQNSDLFSYDCSGTGNTFGMYAGEGGRIATTGSVVTGSNPMATGNGGNISSGVINPWGDNTKSIRSAVAAGGYGTPQVVASNVHTKAIFGSEYYDQLGEWDNSRFTPKQSGLYTISVLLTYMGVNAGVTGEIILYKGGVKDQCMGRASTSSYQDLTVLGSITTDLTAGQTLDIYTQHFAGINLSLTTDGQYTHARITRVA
jgi:hypothetical protein